MAVASKKKKLFQVARELNLGKDTIKEFLEKKGVKVTGLNMKIDADTYELILDRFSREKKLADKIHQRREDRIREEQETEDRKRSHDEEAEKVVEIAEAPEPVADEVVDTEAVAEVNDSAEPVTQAPDVETPVEVALEETAEEATAETTVVEESEPEIAEPAAEEPVAVEEVALADIEVQAEAPTEEAEADIEVQAEAIDESPQVGDIIDHPMAKKYLERQQRLEEEKLERQRLALERLKKNEEKSNKKRKGRQDSEKVPGQGTVGEILVDGGTGSGVSDDIVEESDKAKKKKDRKKGRDTQEEKDARRRKAFEMLRKERRTVKGDKPVAEDEEVAGSKEGRRKRRKKKKNEVDQQEVDTTVKKTLAQMQDTGTGRKKRRKVKTEQGEEEVEVSVIKVTEFITTQDLANLLEEPVTEIIRKCLELGLVVTINQRLDMDSIRLLAEEFGYEVEEEEEFASDFIEDFSDEEENPEDLLPRAPVVTIMGHVDHGKTSLLDYIRETNIVGGESGGITQHIGAYEVKNKNGRKITFLDTPGHEAFTAMRARGAQVTDIVVLVVAADDRVMPQTEEAIDHAKAAGVSIVIAINKMDRPNANAEAIRKQLSERNILVEDWGGQYQSVEVSAKTGQGVDELMEKILLEAELLDLKANPKKRAKGVVLEAQLDKGKGPVATVLVAEGSMEVGAVYVIGQHWGRVRAMINEWGKRVKEVGPASPVQILGMDGMPEAGDRFVVLEDERQAKDISQRRQQLKREQDFRQVRLLTLDELSKQIKIGDVKELKLLVKADVDGSAQALTDSLQKLSTDAVEVQVIRRAVGPITESDVILAAASHAIIIGFHVRPTVSAKEIAERESVDIRQYKVIYDAIEDVDKALEGLLEPVAREVTLGQVEVRDLFKISRLGTIAGCYVLSGKITRNSKVRLVRNDVEIYDGKLASLKRFKDDVREVQSGYECGLNIANFNDIKVGDIIEVYDIVMEAQTLR